MFVAGEAASRYELHRDNPVLQKGLRMPASNFFTISGGTPDKGRRSFLGRAGAVGYEFRYYFVFQIKLAQ